MAGTVSVAFLLLPFLFQTPGNGWTLVPAPPREIKRVYWELFETTEIWVRLAPEDPAGNPPLVHLMFQAFFPGRAERDPYSGLPQWPKGAPAGLAVRAEPNLLTVVRELSLRFVVDGRTLDLTAPGSRYRNLPCLVATDDCTPRAIEAELELSVLRSLSTARSVRSQVLGFTFELTTADQLALKEFAARIGLAEESGNRRR